MSEIKNGRLGLYGPERSKCNYMKTMGFKLSNPNPGQQTNQATNKQRNPDRNKLAVKIHVKTTSAAEAQGAVVQGPIWKSGYLTGSPDKMYVQCQCVQWQL